MYLKQESEVNKPTIINFALIILQKFMTLSMSLSWVKKLWFDKIVFSSCLSFKNLFSLKVFKFTHVKELFSSMKLSLLILVNPQTTISSGRISDLKI